MSPVSRSRKPKKKNTKPRRRRASGFDMVFTHAAQLSSLLEARTWASGVLGLLRWRAWESQDEPEQVMHTAVSELLDELGRVGGTAGMAAARAFSLVGDEEQRADFHHVAEDLALAGVPEPEWFPGYRPAGLAGAYSVTDSAGDLEVIVLDYRDHFVGAVVDHLGIVNVPEIRVGTSAETNGPDFAKELASIIWPDPTPVRVSAAQVRERIVGPLTQLLLNGPTAHAELIEGEQANNATMGLALLEAVVDELPEEPPAADEPDLVELFVAGDVPDKDLARSWALFVTDDALANGRADDSFSVRYAEALLFDRMVPTYRLDDADLAPLAEVVRAWARFVHIDSDDKLPELLDEFATAYRTYDVPDQRLADFRSYHQFRTVTLDDMAFGPVDGEPLPVADLPPLPASATDSAHRLKIKLVNGSPRAWRRVEVRSTITLGELHQVIQRLFGWDDDHLWKFATDAYHFGPIDHDPWQASLGQVADAGDMVGYVFDFGDNWTHRIDVEAVVPAGGSYPRCTGGAHGDPEQYPDWDDDHPPRPGKFDLAAVNARLTGR
ncbi:plasmid pRiA4b ORF-3 family protein [Kutzneria sp. CA-103260]|uniref:plasmid pRiA4b ORF-3 family protein n=1 Tax=Kutzneria sp. CA-103260 TaxID=2802641 RepID=UPI001BA85802|nr:plasmid pRiA4b ORF-3 family protein [Kutzneria sp. CA-103260]QUQ70279.1 Plasmid pRiA4b ORF-3-like protein [Kutzneria sp. CA-103260]